MFLGPHLIYLGKPPDGIPFTSFFGLLLLSLSFFFFLTFKTFIILVELNDKIQAVNCQKNIHFTCKKYRGIQ